MAEKTAVHIIIVNTGAAFLYSSPKDSLIIYSLVKVVMIATSMHAHMIMLKNCESLSL
ncbi:hypothetical protein D3C76_1533690 [compost metagenome]